MDKARFPRQNIFYREMSLFQFPCQWRFVHLVCIQNDKFSLLIIQTICQYIPQTAILRAWTFASRKTEQINLSLLQVFGKAMEDTVPQTNDELFKSLSVVLYDWWLMIYPFVYAGYSPKGRGFIFLELELGYSPNARIAE